MTEPDPRPISRVAGIVLRIVGGMFVGFMAFGIGFAVVMPLAGFALSVLFPSFDLMSALNALLPGMLVAAMAGGVWWMFTQVQKPCLAPGSVEARN